MGAEKASHTTKSAYLAIGYRCNQNCSFCPCSPEEKQEKKMVPERVVLERLSALAEAGTGQITFSGGEPTLHPAFPRLVSASQRFGMRVFVLSNGERFASEAFMEEMRQAADLGGLHVVTTFHSHRREEHESVNGTPGSFARSLEGLRRLSAGGAQITLKHCVTKRNYEELSSFYHYFDGVFPQTVDFQICGIDYCGVDRAFLDEQKLPFPQMRPSLEEMLDCHLERQRDGSRRRLYCIHLPLCSCDVFYWKFLIHKKGGYESYLDPENDMLRLTESNVGVDAKYCGECLVKAACPGTYLSAFSCFGGEMIRPYRQEAKP